MDWAAVWLLEQRLGAGNQGDAGAPSGAGRLHRDRLGAVAVATA
jgi:hypothetical protein